MQIQTHTLFYSGQSFGLNEADHKKLTKIYKSGLTISGVLFCFTPAGEDSEIAISVGSGAPLVIRKLGSKELGIVAKYFTTIPSSSICLSQ